MGEICIKSINDSPIIKPSNPLHVHMWTRSCLLESEDEKKQSRNTPSFISLHPVLLSSKYSVGLPSTQTPRRCRPSGRTSKPKPCATELRNSPVYLPPVLA
jgi:hypothetical protein